MSELLIQCFTCCVTQQRPRKRLRRIDKSIIGTPMHFRHTAHIGSENTDIHLDSLMHQIASKGGYDYALPVNVQIPVIDVKN